MITGDLGIGLSAAGLAARERGRVCDSARPLAAAAPRPRHRDARGGRAVGGLRRGGRSRMTLQFTRHGLPIRYGGGRARH